MRICDIDISEMYKLAELLHRYEHTLIMQEQDYISANGNCSCDIDKNIDVIYGARKIVLLALSEEANYGHDC